MSDDTKMMAFPVEIRGHIEVNDDGTFSAICEFQRIPHPKIAVKVCEELGKRAQDVLSDVMKSIDPRSYATIIPENEVEATLKRFNSPETGLN
jgi:hypothetical protein